MTLIKSKPTSPGRRFRIKISDVELHKGKPYKPLTEKSKKTGGRNNQGRITTRHIGGGHKKKYRIIDFKRDKENMPAKVERLEYDPNRNANIALIQYDDGEKRYIIAPKDLKIGATVISGSNSAISVGNTLPLKEIPVGTQVHCIEMKPGKGAQIARAAGTVAQIMAMEGDYVTIKLRSGELRKIFNKCKATIGEVGNSEYNLQAHGKAGAKRWLGIRPTVRGVAMNPIDHPHGGGEGKTSGGRDPVSPTGIPTKGFKTRSNKRTNNMIVKRRTNKKRK
tara:strand:+ start:635 stop:1471 length:837 start_codon:yes stop_codon:yes gene_type:complete